MNYVLVFIESVCVSIYLNMHFNFDLISSKNMFNIQFYAFAHSFGASEGPSSQRRYNLFSLIFVDARKFACLTNLCGRVGEKWRCFPLNKIPNGLRVGRCNHFATSSTQELKKSEKTKKKVWRQCNGINRNSTGE